MEPIVEPVLVKKRKKRSCDIWNNNLNFNWFINYNIVTVGVAFLTLLERKILGYIRDKILLTGLFH